MFAGNPMRVPHICPNLADVGKAEGPASDLPSSASFFSANSAVFVTYSAELVTNTTVCVTNTVVCVTHTTESQLAHFQSLNPGGNPKRAWFHTLSKNRG